MTIVREWYVPEGKPCIEDAVGYDQDNVEGPGVRSFSIVEYLLIIQYSECFAHCEVLIVIGIQVSVHFGNGLSPLCL